MIHCGHHFALFIGSSLFNLILTVIILTLIYPGQFVFYGHGQYSLWRSGSIIIMILILFILKFIIVYKYTWNNNNLLKWISNNLLTWNNNNLLTWNNNNKNLLKTVHIQNEHWTQNQWTTKIAIRQGYISAGSRLTKISNFWNYQNRVEKM